MLAYSSKTRERDRRGQRGGPQRKRQTEAERRTSETETDRGREADLRDRDRRRQRGGQRPHAKGQFIKHLKSKVIAYPPLYLWHKLTLPLA